MQIITLDKLLKEYVNHHYKCENNKLEELHNERKAILLNFSYSLIVEGSFMEWDNLEIWLNQELGSEDNSRWQWIFYYKTAYDYGSFELFFTQLQDLERLTQQIPLVYGTGQDGSKFISKGYDTVIDLIDDNK
jgi:hypothetical protein